MLFNHHGSPRYCPTSTGSTGQCASEKVSAHNTYLETEAERRRIMAEEETICRLIADIDKELTLLQQELDELCSRCEAADRRLTKAIPEQNRVYLLSTPLDRRIKDLESQKSLFSYYLERSKDDIRRANASWDNLHLLLEGPPINSAEAVQPY